ncbi:MULTISPECIES: DUF3558 domain-containing protein [Nocardia]|uniref:DUF3558 domain-containing protein n=1 Tax=Nocardia TaxID=1817 RepID=UPI000D69BB5A|nr:MULTISPECIES: DUF3558 domain-containing protein [Nocardia]
MAVLGAMSLVAGCGTDSAGKATPSTSTDTSTATAALWDPCTAIPDAVLLKVGVDPATEKSGVGGIEEPGFKICTWNNDDFSIGIFSTNHSVDEFENKPDNTQLRNVSVAGRSAVEHRLASDRFDEVCGLIVPADQGAVQILLRNRSSSKNVVAPCDRVATVGSQVVPTFPE